MTAPLLVKPEAQKRLPPEPRQAMMMEEREEGGGGESAVGLLALPEHLLQDVLVAAGVWPSCGGPGWSACRAFHAAMRADGQKARALLAAWPGAQVPLVLAAKRGKTGVVRELLALAGPPAPSSLEMAQAIAAASVSGHAAVVRELLAKEPTHAVVALRNAAYVGHAGVADAALEGGSRYDSISLHYAAAKGNTDIVTLMLRREDVPASAETDALLAATVNGRLNTVQALVARDRGQRLLRCESFRTRLVRLSTMAGHDLVAEFIATWQQAPTAPPARGT